MFSCLSITNFVFERARRTPDKPLLRKGKILLASIVFVGGAASPGMAQSSAASRIDDLTKEVARVRPLACELGNQRGDIYYKRALVGTVIDLRKAVQARIGEIQQNSGLTEDEKQSILAKYNDTMASVEAAVPPATSGDMDKSIQTVCAFHPAVAVPGTPRPLLASLPETSNQLTLSTQAIDFGDLEVNGDPAEQSFLITNGNDKDFQLKVIPPKDTNGQKFPPDFQLENKAADAEPCSQIIKSKEHCHVYLKFAPNTAGAKSGTVTIVYRQTNNGSTNDGEMDFHTSVKVTGSGHVNDLVSLTSAASNSPYPAFRSVMGFDISGASSANTQQKYFVEFDLNAPIGFSRKIKQTGERIDPLNHRLWAFFNPRITSIPQSPTPLSTLNIQGFSDFLTNTQNKTDLVQGVEVQGGFEVMLLKPRSGIPFWASYKNMHARVGIAWATGVGFTTPFSALSSNPTVFTLPALSSPPLSSDPRIHFSNSKMIDPMTGLAVPIPASFTDIAFVNLDRSRFFRKWYTGLRFKTYHFSDRAAGQCDPDFDRPCEALHNSFPGVIDLTTGQDEQATGGHLSNWVIRIDAIYPLPFIPGANVFGSVVSALHKNNVSSPLILMPDLTTPITNPSVFVVPVGQPFRDTFRIGVGFDLIQILKKAAGNGSQQAAPVGAPQAGK